MPTERKNYDLSILLKPYENKWVALSLDHTRVLGAGDTLEEAKNEAGQTGEEFVFLKLPPYDVSYVPTTP